MVRIAALVAPVLVALLACKPGDDGAKGSAGKKGGAREGGATPSFAWTATPTLASIPEGPIRGVANGRSFEAKSVFVQRAPPHRPQGTWDLVITDEALEDPTDFTTDAQAIHIFLPEVPKVGKVYSQDMKYGGGFFQIRKQVSRSPTLGWNAHNAYILQFTEFENEPYDEEGELWQVTGKASGVVSVMYRGRDEFLDSGAKGTFTDVPVRYMGKPSK